MDQTIFVNVAVDARNPSIDVSDNGETVALSFEATLDLGIIGGVRSGVIVQALGEDLADDLDADEGFSSEADASGQRNSSIALVENDATGEQSACLLYTSPSPRDLSTSRMPSSA